MLIKSRRNEIIDGLRELPEKIKQVLALDEKVQKISQELYQKRSLLIMGRGFNFATCLEGALKVKELTYMHSEGIQAGELKHGPLALVDSTVPILMILMRDSVFTKCMNALQQVTARDGKPILIIEVSKDVFSFFFSTTSIIRKETRRPVKVRNMPLRCREQLMPSKEF